MVGKSINTTRSDQVNRKNRKFASVSEGFEKPGLLQA